MTFRPLLPLALLAASAAHAAPATYVVDPKHTFPHFEADHMGMSKWRGMLTKSEGTVVLDKQAQSGTVDITMDADSIDYGLAVMNAKGRSDEILDAAKYPKITYKGRLAGWTDGKPTRVEGELTLHGVTRPVTLDIHSFKCQPHPLFKRDWCGADASATFQRDQFGIDAGRKYGFDMGVVIRIQVEAVLAE